MTQNERYPLLSRPIELGGVRLKNRIAHASITTRYPIDQRVTQRLIDYHVSRARGGVAMTITEPLAILAWQAGETHKARVFDDREADGLARWAEAVESLDCRLIGQIQDSGRGMHHRGRKPYSFGASSLPDDLSWTVPHALGVDEIEAMVAEIATSTARLQRAGFSGVEISAGHGHLFHQFLSPHSNNREDAYGGDADGRFRLLGAVIDAIRAATTRPFLVLVKLPGDDGVPGGIDEAASGDIAERVAALGQVDALSFCQGSHHRSLENHVPDMHWPRAPFNDLVARLRARVRGRVPVAALGRMVEPLQAEQALADGVGDFVQIGRPLITDPAWWSKAAAGREHDIRWCVSCNSCWGLIADKQPIACDNNPRVGAADETNWWPAPLPAPRDRKRVVVVGTGVAGLEAAWIAASRGHEVIALGAGASYGGKTALHARLPGSDQVSSVYDFQYVKAVQAGTRFEFGVTADLAMVRDLSPDAVVLATGSRMSWPARLPADWMGEGFVPDLREAVTSLLDLKARQQGTAVLFDADHTAGTYAAAQLLSETFERVVIATPRGYIAGDEALVVQQGIVRRMNTLGIDMIPYVDLGSDSPLEEGRIHLVNVHSGRVTAVEDVSLLTYATPRLPNDGLAAPLRALGLPVHLIGDCYAPRWLMTATHEGHALGTRL